MRISVCFLAVSLALLATLSALDFSAERFAAAPRFPLHRLPLLGVLLTIAVAMLGCARNDATPPTSATTPASLPAKAPPPRARTYTTQFPLTENPLSENGHWITGATTGLDWGDISTTAGQTHPHPGPKRYADATALLTGPWAADQMAQGTVYVNKAHNYPEVELRLRSSLSAHKCNGYEIAFALPPNAYLLIVRWNGPLADYTILTEPRGPQYQVKAGDVVKATIVGNVITAYKNGVKLAEATDNTYAAGQPGMGFNEQINGDYGFSSFTASELVPESTSRP